jgi:DNA repair exonuclease SbcCD ATPase subunit
MNENLDPTLHVNDDENMNQQAHAEVTTETQLPSHQALTKEEIITKLQDLNNQEETPSRSDVESLKQAFYKIRSTEITALKNQFIADGGEAESFIAPTDSLEEEIKALLNNIKEKRAKALEEEEKEKEKNLQDKLQIIDSIKNLTENTDEDFNKLYKEFKDLQQKWNEIKLVPAAKVNELWKSYQIYSEKFYDLIKINNEFRDYDFKKNLELKTAICESVEKLMEEPDVVSAFHQLQNFHQQWREIGPVAKELRDEIWNRFKTASTEINKRHQSHFEHLKSQEENNLTEKTAICEALKSIDYSTLKSFKDWDEKSKEVIDLQAKWKTIGFVPRKFNNQIFEQYRALCDTFFEKKAEFFKHQKDEMEVNLEKKKALLAKAESLKESTDWKKTTDEMIAIQKEWKAIGTVPRKYSDTIWKEFVAACDYFFEQKNKNTSSQKEEEVVNLGKKKEVIEKINALTEITDPKQAMDNLRLLMDEWHGIGFVPFKEKDKIYKEYQAALDVQFDRLKVDKAERRMQSFISNLDDIVKSEKPKGRLFRERDRLVHQFNKVKSDLQTYENNMGFLSISKGAGGLLKDMEHKIQDLKNELELISQKIETIDNNLKDID